MARRHVPSRFPTLVSALESYRVDELKGFVALVLDGGRPPTRKADLVEAIATAAEADGLEHLVGRLDELARTALSEAVHVSDGEHRTEHFRAKYGKEPRLGESGRWSGKLTRPRLLHLFLHRRRHDLPLHVPNDLLEPLRSLLDAPRAAELRSTADPPECYLRPEQYLVKGSSKWKTRHEPAPLRVRETEAAARHDLAAVLALVDAGQIAVTEKKKHPTAAATRTISEVLIGGDFYGGAELAELDPDGDPRIAERIGAIRAFAWPLLLQADRLARPWGRKLKLTKEGRAAMGAPPAEVIAGLWDSWTWTDLLDEFSRIEVIRGQSGRGRRGLVPVDERRDVVAGVLAECPSGEWVTVEELWRYMRASGHDFEVSRNLWDLYIEEKQYGSLGYAGYGSWEVLQGRYVLAVLFEYAATLGLVDVAYASPAHARIDFRHIWGTDEHFFLSRYDGLAAFRLTGLGAYCLGLSEEYRPSAPETRSLLAVLPNLEVAVLEGAAVPPADRLVLDRFAEPVSERVWRLDRERILAAAEEGHRVDALRDLLSARAADGLPEVVEDFLAEIARRASRLRDLGAARLVDCGESELAALIASDPATRRSCMRAGEQHLAVPAGKEAAFRKGLRRIGWVLPGRTTEA